MDTDDGQRRYPENQMQFPLQMQEPIHETWQRFFDLREDWLLGYHHNTARAYWADLQDMFEWAVEHDKDILQLTEKDLTQYKALLRRRKYSENTIRRRMCSYKGLQRSARR